MTAAGSSLSPILGSRWHADRPVRLAEQDGRLVVIKRYPDGDAVAIYLAMTKLWCSPFGFRRVPPGLPEPISVHLHRGEITMSRVIGTPLAGPANPIPVAAASVASLLADLHGSGVLVPRPRSPRKLLRSCARKADELWARSSPLARAAEDVVARLADALPGPGPGGREPR
jgi:hypothetical protein